MVRFLRMDPQEKRQEKNPIIKRIEAVAQAYKFPALFYQFLSFFLSQASLEDLAQYAPEEWVRLVSHGFDACHAQKGRRSSVTLYNLSDLSDLQTQGGDQAVIEIVHPHLPFLVDSLYATLVAERHHISLFLHLILKITRTAEGTLLSLERGKASLGEEGLESFLHIHLENPLSSSEKRDLQQSLEAVIQDVKIAVEEWQPMRERVQKCLEEIHSSRTPLSETEKKEQSDLLKWLDEGFFTFLGYRFYGAAAGGAEETLGVAKTHKGSFFGPDERTEQTILSQTGGLAPYFSVTKTMVQSKVHRPVPMDVIRFTAFDSQGNVRGEHEFFGLFTAAVYNARLQDIPFIQTKVAQVLKACHVQPDWYDGRRLMYILESLPRDLLFQISVAELAKFSQSILKLKERHKLSLFVLPDPLGHFMWNLIYIPRDRYTAALAGDMGEMLADCYKGALVSHNTHIGGDLSFARVEYIISTDAHPQHKIMCDIQSTELALSELSLSWEECLKKEYREHTKKSDLMGTRLFSSAYQEHFSVREALKDLPFIEEAVKTASKGIRFYQSKEDTTLHVKIFSPAHPLFLSDIFPTLEHMGLRILTEASYKIGQGSESVWLHHFKAEPAHSPTERFQDIYGNFLKVLTKVLHQKAEDDSFNRLVLVSNLTDRHLLLVRAYYHYLCQLGWPFMRAAIVSALERYPSFLKKLGQLFYKQFDPASSAAAGEEEALFSMMKEDLMAIESGEDEAILSGLLTLIRATQRTNFFQLDDAGNPKEYVSLKFLPALIEPLSDTKPLYEVFVYAPEVEAIHLRSGKVSRGGIRWSDRRLDYRKEVLELMKAQLVKNAVIVPMGAKGGFYVRTPLEHLSFAERQDVGIQAYKTMIRGLLDITDNLVDGHVIPPPFVKRRDEDDPYLVVAADKGTATFSDIANELSKDYGFWLGDAFASGGSAGYDHKKMGITSRGAWESVKRHFRELDKKMDHPFTVVGVGDMSGDVFGNGMLLSPKIQLVAAFNHAHILIDPRPDVEVSYKERKRLFELPRSQWSDYNPALLSKGGGIFERKAKSIRLSADAQALLKVTERDIKPDTLIQQILKLPVDLLWFGGIGTYVKDRKETEGEVGDRANEAVRVNGQDVRAQIIGEGANLAMTQRGRIAYALKGGKLNRDSVDNSAGVDCSDHEVNIKILFQGIVKAGKLQEEGRNTLLKEMTAEVAQLILRHNYLQTQAISLIESRGYKALARQNRLIRFLEAETRLNRDQEALPSEEDVERRIEKQRGLTRPEIAVLVSYTKLYLYEKILESDLPESPDLTHYLRAYFPKPLQEKYPTFIDQHPLKRELIATSEANFLVNRLGTTFFFELEERLKTPLTELIRLFAQMRWAWKLEAYWVRIESLEGAVPYQMQNKLFNFLISFLPEPGPVFQKRLVRDGMSEKELERLRAGILHVNQTVGSTDLFRKFLAQLTEIL